MGRAVGMLLCFEEADGVGDTDPLRSCDISWLPSPADLLRLAEAERAWDVFLIGGHHPAVACAAVAARLGRWEDARLTCEGVLKLLRQPLVRYEAYRLLSRCAAATDQASLAHDHLRAAADEARHAGYWWLAEQTTLEVKAHAGKQEPPWAPRITPRNFKNRPSTLTEPLQAR